MPRVFTEILGSVDHVPFASKIVYSVGYTLSIYTLLGTSPEIFLVCHALASLDARFEHFARFLAELRVLVVIWFKVGLPNVPKFSHVFNNK